MIASLFVLASMLISGFTYAQTQNPTSPTTSKAAQPATQQAEAKPKNTSPVPWKKVPDSEKKVLAPLEPEWSQMPGTQQRKLLGAAKEYPKLTPVEQDRFQERLRGWSSLSPDQRKAARDKYQSLNNLPPQKQQELKARWQQEKSADKNAPPKADTTVVAPVK